MFIKLLLFLIGIISLLFISPAMDVLADDKAFDNDAEAAKNLVAELSNNLTQDQLTVKIGPLTMEPAKLSGPFAARFLTLMEVSLKSSEYLNDFVKVERELITRDVIRTRGRIIDNPSEDLGEVILKGVYQVEADSNTIVLKCWLEKVDGTEVSRASVRIAKSAIGLPLEPENGALIKKESNQIDQNLDQNKDFKINLWINRENGGLYQDKEELMVYFQSDMDCYLKVLYIDVQGNKILMYPTSRDSQSRLAAGVVHELHRKNRYTIQPPFGSEMIIAIASTQQLPDAGEKNISGGYQAYSQQQSTTEIIDRLSTRAIGVSGQNDGPLKISETRVFLTTTARK